MCLFGEIFLSCAHTFSSIVALCNTSDRCNLTKKWNIYYFMLSFKLSSQFFIKNNYSTDKIISKIIFQGYFRYFLINYLEIKVKNLRFPFCNKKYASFKLKWNIYLF